MTDLYLAIAKSHLAMVQTASISLAICVIAKEVLCAVPLRPLPKASLISSMVFPCLSFRLYRCNMSGMADVRITP